MALKVTTWNIEHSGRLLSASPSADVLERRRRIRETVEAIDPDILCMQEGPKGEQAALAFAADVLGGAWTPILLPASGEAQATRDRAYETLGTQWAWFLVRAGLAGRARLQPPATWAAFTGNARWRVHKWGEEAFALHEHYRHPQVLLYDAAPGLELELVSVHLKSKINQMPIERDAAGDIVGEYLREALEARIKLATEARNVRDYVAARFEQVPQPALLIMGDCNDGPGQDYFELEYLFFDLVTNLQGEVLLAERFFNHALFDFPAHLRWTAKFRDEVLGIPESRNPLLLDHILISQPLCRDVLPLTVRPHAGGVEHEAFERGNAGASSRRRTSDHRPVSVTLSDNP
jgi:endonuclease/exonuclease/phosphatase family metal-dependent hydrolase